MYKLRLISNTLKSGTVTVIGTLTQLALTPFIISKMGLENFGLMNAALLFSALNVGGLFDLGMQPVVSRAVAQKKLLNDNEAINQVLNTSLSLLFFIGLIITIVGLIFRSDLTNLLNVTDANKPLFSHTLVFVFSVQFIQFPLYSIWGLFEGLQEFGTLRSAQILTLILSAAASVGLLLFDFGFDYLVYAQLSASLIQMLILLIVIKAKLKFIEFSFRHITKPMITEILGFSKLLSLGKISSYLFYQFDRVIISVLMGPAYLGAYEILMKPAKLLKIFSGVGGSASLPVASELHAQDNQKKLKQLFLAGLKLLFYLNIPISLILGLFSEEFLTQWISPEISHLTIPLRILIFWNIISIPTSYGFNILLGRGVKMQEMIIASYIATAAKIISICLLITPLGLTGAALSFVISSIAVQLYSVKFFRSDMFCKNRDYLIPAAKIILTSLPILLIIAFIKSFAAPQSLAYTLAVATISSMCLWVWLYHFLMSSDEKQSIQIIYHSLVKRS